MSERFVFASVCLGGASGAILRVGISLGINNQILAILICNVLGTFVLSAAMRLRQSVHPHIHHMISAGFCGGLTTFASFSRDSVFALKADDYLLFFGNTAANILLCICAIFAAEIIVDRFLARRNRMREIGVIIGGKSTSPNDKSKIAKENKRRDTEGRK